MKALELVAIGKDQASAALDNVGKSVGNLDKIAAGAATGGLALAAGAILAVGMGAVAAGKHIAGFLMDATDSMTLFQAQTGVTKEELSAFTDVAAAVYKSGMGESFDAVTVALSEVHRGLQVTGEELEDATRRALILEEVFAYDVSESIAVTSTMMANFGISSEESFDTLTKGSQMGLDRMGDLGDTLQEYSSDFFRLGFTVEDTLKVLNEGLAAGAYNTDVIADGIREFGIRFMEMGDTGTEALESIGLSAEDMYTAFSAGEITVKDAMDSVIEHLLSIEDPLERAKAGVALFGTKWEDIGEDIFLSIGGVEGSLEGLTGATDQAGDDLESGLGAAVERFKRTFEVAFLPLGEKLGEMIDTYITPNLEEWALWLEDNLPKAIETLMGWLDNLGGKMDGLITWHDEFNERAAPQLETSLENIWQMVDQVRQNYEGLTNAWSDVLEALGLQDSALGDLEGAFISLVQTGIDYWLYPALLKIGGQLAIMTGGLDLVAAAVKKVKKWFNDLKDALARFELPWWLRPGSPTPLELGLMGIGKALKDMPDIGVTFGLGTAAAAMPGGGATSTTMINIVNHFGPGSVRSDEDIAAITLAQERSFRLRSGMVGV